LNRSFILKGHICHTPEAGRLEIRENAFAVCENGICRGVFDAVPDCFVVQTDMQDYIMDYEGNQYHPLFMDDAHPERITPLVWYGETGVFLAEEYSGESFAVGEYLLKDGIEPGERHELEKTKGDGHYHCWLMDETGKTILGADKVAFTIQENGDIHMQNADGTIDIYPSPAND